MWLSQSTHSFPLSIMKRFVQLALATATIISGTFIIPVVAEASTATPTMLSNCNADYQLPKGTYECEIAMTRFVTPVELNNGVNTINFDIVGIGNFLVKIENTEVYVNGIPVKADIGLGYRHSHSRKIASMSVFPGSPIAVTPVKVGRYVTVVVRVLINENTMMAEPTNVNVAKQ